MRVTIVMGDTMLLLLVDFAIFGRERSFSDNQMIKSASCHPKLLDCVYVMVHSVRILRPDTYHHPNCTGSKI